MIPTTLLAGLLLGRWWWTILPITVGWALLLGADGTFTMGGVAFGSLNGAVGIAIHQGVLVVVRMLRPKSA